MSTRRTAAVIFLVLWTMSMHGKPSNAGDEPYYLIVAQSLAEDHDLDLRNNFANDGAARIGHEGLSPSPHVIVRADGTWWSVHDIGLSVLTVPAYLVGRAAERATPATWKARVRLTEGRMTYAVVSLFMLGLVTAAMAILHRTLAQISTDGRATIVTLIVALSPPVLAHSFLVFAEIPALLVTCIAIAVALTPATRVRLSRLVLSAIALGALPWCHRKFGTLVVGLLAAVVWQHRDRWRRRPGDAAAVAAAFAIPLAACFAFSFAAWGSVRGPQLAILARTPFAITAIPAGAAGLLLDRSRGLLPYAPIVLLLPFVWRRGRRWAIWLLPVAAYFLPMASYVAWSAGYSPAARFLVPLMPLLALPAVDTVWTTAFKRAAVALLVVQCWILGLAWNRPRVLWPGEVGDNRVWTSTPVVGRAVNRLFPVIDPGSWRESSPS